MSIGFDHAAKLALTAWNGRGLAPYESITVRRLSPVLGAEIGGVDLAAGVSDKQLKEIRRALNENLAVVFRDQPLTPEQHKTFARRFGHLHQHKLAAKRAAPEQKVDHEILAWRTDADSRFTAGEAWHADVTCDEQPLWGSLLRVPELPVSGGGDTAFANMYLAYEFLSDSLKTFLVGLTAIHDGALPWSSVYGIRPEDDSAYPQSEHPVVLTHPFTGQKLLFVNPGFTTRIKQLEKAESDAVLAFLFRHVERHPALQVRIDWTQDALVFWDNWATQHHAIWDYYPNIREGQRVSVVVDTPLHVATPGWVA
jgi:taurine dioxygenase